jgi:hypothetical protein
MGFTAEEPNTRNPIAMTVQNSLVVSLWHGGSVFQDNKLAR